MKIMQIVPSFEVGGAETMCAGLCKALAAMGHSVVAVSLASIPTQITRQLAEAGVDVRYLDKKPGMDLGCVGRLRALICRERPQVLHTHLHALKYAALTFTGVPMIHTIHNQAEQEAVSLDQKIGRFLFRQGKALPVALSPQIRDSIVRLYGLPEGQIFHRGGGLEAHLIQPHLGGGGGILIGNIDGGGADDQIAVDSGGNQHPLALGAGKLENGMTDVAPSGVVEKKIVPPPGLNGDGVGAGLVM